MVARSTTAAAAAAAAESWAEAAAARAPAREHLLSASAAADVALVSKAFVPGLSACRAAPRSIRRGGDRLERRKGLVVGVVEVVEVEQRRGSGPWQTRD